MNRTVAHLTVRTLLGRRRALLLVILPVLLLALAVLIRAVGPDEGLAMSLLGGFALGIVVPVLAVIAGTGAIAPEIDDGSIAYLLTKPVSRRTIVVTKAAVAAALTALFGAVPTLLAGLLVREGPLALGYGVGALVAGTAYVALFVLLGVVSRNAAVVGLLYAVVWESLVGGLVPGARALSVQQWALSVTHAIVGTPVESAVRLPVGVALLAVVTVAAMAYAGVRLARIHLTVEE